LVSVGADTEPPPMKTTQTKINNREHVRPRVTSTHSKLRQHTQPPSWNRLASPDLSMRGMMMA
jgi:hypothetical protein